MSLIKAGNLPCPECGLPLRICNAIRIYRRAAHTLRTGLVADTKNLLDEADTEFERWQRESKEKTRPKR